MSNIKIIFQLLCLLFVSCSKEEDYFFNPSDSIFNSSLNIVGTNQTLDLITWNIENFPKNNLTNLYVKQIIDSLNVDIVVDGHVNLNTIPEMYEKGDFIFRFF